MSTHNDDLLDELREARKKRRLARTAMDEAHTRFLELRAAFRRASEVVEEIGDEIEKGTSGRPLIDAARNGNGHAGGYDRDVARALEMTEERNTRFIDRPPAGWDEAAARAAIVEIEGDGAKGTRTVVCRSRECRAARHKEVDKCRCGERAWDLVMEVARGADFPSLHRAAMEARAAESRPDGGTPCDLHGGRPWTDEDVDALLVHACRRHSTGLAEWFAEATEAGADDAGLYAGMRSHWPHSRVFTGPDRTGRKHGYTLCLRGSELQFWVGAYTHSGHVPTLAGQALLDRVRSVMGVPMPAERPWPAAGMDPVTAEKPQPPAAKAGRRRKAAVPS